MRDITETITRKCCKPQDLKPVYIKTQKWEAFFCVYCGQLWSKESRRDAAGGTESYLHPIDMMKAVRCLGPIDDL